MKCQSICERSDQSIEIVYATKAIIIEHSIEIHTRHLFSSIEFICSLQRFVSEERIQKLNGENPIYNMFRFKLSEVITMLNFH